MPLISCSLNAIIIEKPLYPYAILQIFNLLKRGTCLDMLEDA